MRKHLEIDFLRCVIIACQSDSFIELIRVGHKSPTKPNREPVDKLSDGDEADSKAKSTDPSKAGDEVQPGHLGGSLVLWTRNENSGF